jgi:hypothetical protein
MQRNVSQQTLVRHATMIASAILLAATAGCSTLEASLDHGADASSTSASGDTGILGQMARDSQSGG